MREPLMGMRVLETIDERGEMCGRLLADLGATVTKVEPPEGSPSRHDAYSFAYRNANKHSVVRKAEPAPEPGVSRVVGRRGRGHEVEPHLEGADIWVTGRVDATEVLERHPRLVVVSVTDFGLTGPYRDFVGSELVDVAMGGLLYRSGPPDRPPLSPPGLLAYDVAGVTAALAALTAYWQRLHTGRGQHLDVSVMESVANLADWALPNYAANATTQHRQGAGLLYPIFPCANGHVCMVLPLAPRQWAALREWLGQPNALAGEDWESVVHRFQHLREIAAFVIEHFRHRSMTDLSTDGQSRGLAVTPVLRPAEVLDNEHATARGTFVDAEIRPGVTAKMFAGFFEIDGERHGFRHPAPALDEHPHPVSGDQTDRKPAASVPGNSPFAGLRVLDFGVGAVGVEVGRLFAEYGADVIKVESITYPDFMRTVMGGLMNPAFASSNRTKRGLGVNMKTERGRQLVEDLVAMADVVVENNATDVMERLGLGWDRLRQLNPRLVMAQSQLLGSHGPWRTWSGYGPNTRPVAGLTYLWNHAGNPDEPGGVSTIHPDHFAGRVLMVGALAALIARERSDVGAHVEVAQFEAVIGTLADLLLRESVEPGSVAPEGNDSPKGAPWGPFPCAGDDEWCAISVRTDDEWQGFADALGHPDWTADDRFATHDGRVTHRRDLNELVAGWTGTRTPAAVMHTLQQHGVPAGIVMHPALQVDDPHVQARRFPQAVDQPPLGPLLLEGPAFRGTDLPDPVVNAAPGLGEHTREICRDLLALKDDEIDVLIAEGVLEEHLP